MKETTVVEQRLNKLEQDNRRLKAVLASLLLVLAAVPLVGAVMPEQIPYLVQAQQFRVIDANGVRIGMNAEGITYYDENGMRRATMERDGVSYSDENDTLRLSMGVFGTGSGIVYYDENSNPRAAMGKVALATPATGAATSYQTQVALYDAEGNVIWKALR